MEEHPEDYRSLTYEDWCDLLSTIEVKDERKREATQINKIAYAGATPLSENNESVKIPRKNNSRTGILRSNEGPQKKVHKRQYPAIFRAL